MTTTDKFINLLASRIYYILTAKENELANGGHLHLYAGIPENAGVLLPYPGIKAPSSKMLERLYEEMRD